ncbi:MAG: pentapeptide repeat-containing protein [Planctomycetota bacterium]
MRFINGDLSNCRFERPLVAFAEIARSRLTGSTFEDGEIRNTIFSSSKLDLSSFRYCKLFNCQFVKCSLREVDWQGAELNAVSFLECDLSGSQFSQASFDKADLRSSSIGGAAFSLENLRGLIAEPSQCAIFATMLGVTVADPIYPDTEMG